MSKECSAGISKAWRFFSGHEPPFEHCCDRHDEAYRKGGSRKLRKIADKRLRTCVESNGYPGWARVMYYGVRWFGWIFWGRE